MMRMRPKAEGVCRCAAYMRIRPPALAVLQVKGAASDVADKAADVGGGALQNVKPKRGFFERINDEALTKNSPSVQQKR